MDADSAVREFPPLRQDLVAGTPRSVKRVLIVTQDILGPVNNGGIGTAYYYLAEELAAQGHRVSILFSLGRYSANSDFGHWVAWYADKAIELIPCPNPEIGALSSVMGEACALPYRVYDYLKRHANEYDIVHASEWGANLYYCLQAKRLGLAFENLHFVVKASSPLLWSKLGNRQPLDSLVDLPRIYMERRSIEMADTVISGSRYMLGWMWENGYRLAADRCFVQPNVFPVIDAPVRSPAPGEINELVFFGRLEPRKGLAVYLDALRLLHKRIGDARFSRLKLTFLGKRRRDYDAGRVIGDSLGKFGDRVSILDQMGQPEALAYLSGADGALAIMPSLIDNSPFGVYELLAHRVPFVTSNRGGGKELIDRGEWDRVIFDPQPVAICDCLAQSLDADSRPVMASFGFDASLDTWRNWHLQPVPARACPVASRQSVETPLVSICLVTCNRAEQLAQAIASIEAISYRPFELILVDDASDLESSIRYLDVLESRSFDFPFRLIRQSKQYLGAARNNAARAATGKYLLFMDDDNLARPEELDCLVQAAEVSGADVLTCFSDMFLDSTPGKGLDGNRILFVGGDLASGLYCNPYGDSNCLVRNSAFGELGGFDEEFKVGRDDQEFFTRALLRGYRLELVPEPLYWYRIGKSRMRQHHYSRFAGHQRVADTFIGQLGLGPDLANALRYAQSLAADDTSVARLLVRKLIRINALRRTLYRFPRLLRWLRPLVRRLI